MRILTRVWTPEKAWDPHSPIGGRLRIWNNEFELCVCSHISQRKTSIVQEKVGSSHLLYPAVDHHHITDLLSFLILHMICTNIDPSYLFLLALTISCGCMPSTSLSIFHWLRSILLTFHLLLSQLSLALKLDICLFRSIFVQRVTYSALWSWLFSFLWWIQIFCGCWVWVVYWILIHYLATNWSFPFKRYACVLSSYPPSAEGANSEFYLIVHCLPGNHPPHLYSNHFHWHCLSGYWYRVMRY